MSSRDGIQSASLLPVLLALFLYFFTAGCVQVDKGDNSGTAHRNWNVLFIAVDDLRPALGCYGESQVQSPHIDRLAQEGMVFQRAYCQVSVCNPSRSSLLTGLRPDSVKVFNNGVHFRNTVPDVVTLPQHFKNHGYHTQAVGKIYHSSFEPGYHGRSLDDPASWSQPSWFPGPRFYHTDAGIEVARRVYGRRPDCGHGKGGLCIHNRWQPLSEQSITDPSDDRLSAWTEHFVQGLITEAPELPDIQLLDGTVTERALETLRELRDQEKFLLAVGFNKPHTPYVAPRQYWDLYDRSRLRLPSNRQVPERAPAMAVPRSHDHRAYTGIAGEGLIDDAAARRQLHGYYACVSFIDAQVGRMLEELERLGLEDRTIVVFWGDHGYHLGENGRWGKQTCFETATRSPLIVRVPGMQGSGSKTRALVELIDIYPTLCRLAGLPVPEHVEGDSFAPLLEDPSLPWKSAAFSQYPRPVPLPERAPDPEDLMGYSMRTDRYRLTLWQRIAEPHRVVATELYDHREDPGETRNLATNPDYSDTLAGLQKQLELGWEGARPNSRSPKENPAPGQAILKRDP